MSDNGENDLTDSSRRFTLESDKWYACEFIGDEFSEDRCSYSPIRVDETEPLGSGARRFRLSFYHANYPEGVRDKRYVLETIERGTSFILARSTDHEPARLLQIYEIDWSWLTRHFPSIELRPDDIQQWLSRNG